MPVGDGDLAVFFVDFGVPVVYNGQSAMGNLDQPSDPFAGAGGISRMESQRYSLTLPYKAFSSVPVSGDSITVAGVLYKVQGRSRSDDGKILSLELHQ